MNDKMQHLLANWKSSVQPILTLILFAAPAATAPGSPIHNPTLLWLIALAAGIAKVGIGFITQDAGTTIAQTPDGIKAVDSHEVPNDPSAIPTQVTK